MLTSAFARCIVDLYRDLADGQWIRKQKPMKVLNPRWYWRTLVIFILIVLTCGCTTLQSSLEVVSHETTLDNEDKITLYRGLCLGECPNYEVQVTGTGAVYYEGQSYVEVKGIQQSQLSPEDTTRLFKRFERAGFFELDELYIIPVPDVPSFMMMMSTSEGTKEVWRMACGPSELIELERLVDKIVGIEKWVGYRPYLDEEPYPCCQPRREDSPPSPTGIDEQFGVDCSEILTLLEAEGADMSRE